MQVRVDHDVLARLACTFVMFSSRLLGVASQHCLYRSRHVRVLLLCSKRDVAVGPPHYTRQ